MSEKSSKKRLVLTISSLCVAVVAVVCSIVAIFAATSQSVKTTFKVTYSATNVAATVSANYTVKNGTKKALGEAITIKAEDADNTKYATLSSTEDIALTTANNEVVFEYIFKNNSEDKAFKVTLSDGAKKDNVTVSYATTTTENDADLSYSSTVPTNVDVAASGTTYIYIKVVITNLANAAEYTADDATPISWSLVA